MMDIREMTIGDYAEVFDLWHRSEGVGLSDGDSRENIQQYLDRNPGMSFVALMDNNIVGAVLAGHDGRRGYIYHLAVDSHHRKQGIGRNLVDHCVNVMAESGIKKCHIFIFNENAAGIAFWKSIEWSPRSDISVISKNIE
jgi:N-acetylglutamate synthase